jgi:hypothetical protein
MYSVKIYVAFSSLNVAQPFLTLFVIQCRVFSPFVVLNGKRLFIESRRKGGNELKTIFSHLFPHFFLSLSNPTALKHSPSKRKSLSRVAQQRSTESEADSHGKPDPRLLRLIARKVFI